MPAFSPSIFPIRIGETAMMFRTGTKSKKALPCILGFSILLMIVSSYSNTFTSPYYLDDFQIFIYPKALHLHSISLSNLFALSRTPAGWARFLPNVSFAINNYLHGNIIYFHAVNILIHLLAFLAVFWFFREVLAAERITGPEGEEIPYSLATIFPVCVAAIWALSPVQTSAVTYLVQRIASMEALFFTLSAACFLRARLLAEKKPRSAIVFYCLCACAALCAGLSKQNAAMLPVILAVIDIWFFDSAWLKIAWGVCRKTGWKIRTGAVVAMIWSSYYACFKILPQLLSGYSYRDFTLIQRLLTEARVVVWYMSLLLWPLPSRLCMEHDTLVSTSLVNPLTTFPAILLIAALIYLAVRFRKRFPIITFGIVWFFLNLAIESTIIPLELVFEHRLYLPSVGFYLAVAALFAMLLRKISKRLPEIEFAKAACSLLLVCASVLALLTFTRNCAWKNALTIHYDSVTKAPDSPRANADFASVLCRFGYYEQALKYAEKAIRIGKKNDEEDVLAQNDITLALTKEGKSEEAIKRENKFLKKVDLSAINCDFLPDLCLNVSSACIAAKKPGEAYEWALKALKFVQITTKASQYKKGLVERGLLQVFSLCDPRDAAPGIVAKFGKEKPSPVALTAMVFMEHGEAPYAQEIIAQAYAKDPRDPWLKDEIAKIKNEDAQNLAQKKNWNTFQKYVQSPFTPFHFDMAVAYLVQKDNLSKWCQRIGKNRLDAALIIHPDSREARLLKAWYLYHGNDAKEAVKIVGKVLANDPGNANVWLALGFFRAKAGDTNGAVAAFKKVIQLYPGYPKRAIVEQLCSQLESKGKLIESASASK